MTVLPFRPRSGRRPPSRGKAPSGGLAWATLLLAAAICAVFAWQTSLDSFGDARAVYSFGVLPAHLFGYRIPAPQIDQVPPIVTLLSAQFLHGGWIHLIGNVVVLVLLGPATERAVGGLGFILVYLLSGVVGLGIEAAAAPSSAIPIIGASASIAGVIGALARRDARARMVLPAPRRGHWTRLITVPVLPVIGIWLILQVYGIAFEEGESENTIAFLAHGAGFVAGALIAGWRPLRRSDS